MKVIYLVIVAMFSVLSANVSFAEDSWKNEAQGICKKLSSWDSTIKCLKMVKTSDYLSVPALKLCDGLSSTRSFFNCFDIIQNQQYTEDMLQLCHSAPSTRRTLECMEVSGTALEEPVDDQSDQSQDEEAEEDKTNVTTTSESEEPQQTNDNMTEVTNKDICTLFENPEDQEECYFTVVSAVRDKKALKLCQKRAEQETFAKSCLSAIAGKQYNKKQISSCRSKSNPLLLKCLSNKGEIDPEFQDMINQQEQEVKNMMEMFNSILN